LKLRLGSRGSSLSAILIGGTRGGDPKGDLKSSRLVLD
jgi:hypothetical protein